MGQIQFVRGQFQSFRATNTIHVGRYLLDIPHQAVFGYDGYTVRHGGAEYEVPQLQGLFGTWFVPAADQTTQYRSQPAGVQVRAATPEGEQRGVAFSMGRADEDHTVVGSMDNTSAMRKAASDPSQAGRLAELRAQRQAPQRPALAQREPASWADSNPEAPPPQNSEDVDYEVEAALMEDVNTSYVQARPVNQDGFRGTGSVSAGELRDVQEANRRNMEAIARKTAQLNHLDPPKTRDEMGGTRHDAPDQGTRRAGGGKYAIVRDEQDDGVPVKEYRFSGGATVGGEDQARQDAQAKPVNVTRVAAMQPVQVGNAVASTPSSDRRAGARVIDDPMYTHQPQAVRARNTTQVPRHGNVGIDEIGPGGGTGDVDYPASSEDLSELLPDAAVAGLDAPRKVTLPPPPSEDEEIAEVVAGWSVKRNWQKRVEEAVEFYSDWPEALNAIMAIESEPVVKQIQTRIAAKLAAG